MVGKRIIKQQRVEKELTAADSSHLKHWNFRRSWRCSKQNKLGPKGSNEKQKQLRRQKQTSNLKVSLVGVVNVVVVVVNVVAAVHMSRHVPWLLCSSSLASFFREKPNHWESCDLGLQNGSSKSKLNESLGSNPAPVPESDILSLFREFVFFKWTKTRWRNKTRKNATRNVRSCKSNKKE